MSQNQGNELEVQDAEQILWSGAALTPSWITGESLWSLLLIDEEINS